MTLYYVLAQVHHSKSSSLDLLPSFFPELMVKAVVVVVAMVWLSTAATLFFGWTDS